MILFSYGDFFFQEMSGVLTLNTLQHICSVVEIYICIYPTVNQIIKKNITCNKYLVDAVVGGKSVKQCIGFTWMSE